MGGRSKNPRGMRRVAEVLPFVFFAFGCLALAFGAGVMVAHFEIFPYHQIADSARTARTLWTAWTRRPASEFSSTRINADEVSRRWVMPRETIADGAAFLLTGGRDFYLQYCPEYGCAAVILGRDGRLIHAYPFRPYELKTKRIVEMPMEQVGFDEGRKLRITGMAPLEDGTLIVVLTMIDTFPYGGGIARLDKEGRVLWYRQDYSNHWPQVTDKREILDISYGVDRVPFSFSLRGSPQRYAVGCDEGYYRDVVRVLDLNGAVKEEIPVFDALAKSPYRVLLTTSSAPDGPSKHLCDPLHTNSVSTLGAEFAAKVPGTEPEDLLLSLRNISTIVIMGRHDHRIKHVIRGSFLWQHSVHPLPDGRIILFDDFGAADRLGTSRVLTIDAVTGQETTIFPTADTPKDYQTFTRVLGTIDIARDRSRVLVSFGESGQGYELRLADGAVLTHFDNVHDLRKASPAAREAEVAHRVDQYGIYYVYPELLANL